MAQDRIAYRIYYRRKVEFGGLACPYVFTVEPKTGDLTFDTTILYRLSSRDLETSQSRALHHFDGKVVIREIEPETSFIDQIFVTVTDAFGTAHILRAKAKTLQSADSDYLILRRGDEVAVEFDGFQSIERPTAVTITAKGYYQPAVPKNALSAFW
jgi:hypothetical protein